MKKITIFLFIAGCSLTMKAQDCKSIQTGTFRITADSVSSNESFLIRTKNVQIEEVKSLGLKLQFTIKWTSDCSYTLSNPKILKGELPGVNKDQEVYTKIIKITSTYYTAEVTSNFSDMKIVKDVEIVK